MPSPLEMSTVLSLHVDIETGRVFVLSLLFYVWGSQYPVRQAG